MYYNLDKAHETQHTWVPIEHFQQYKVKIYLLMVSVLRSVFSEFTDTTKSLLFTNTTNDPCTQSKFYHSHFVEH